MNFKQTLDIVKNSKIFQKFLEDFPNAEFCAGFFILDYLSNDNKQTLDYKVDKKIFTFSVDNNDITMMEDKLIEGSGKKLEKIMPYVKIELEELKSIAGMHALEQGISEKFQKIIAVLQKYENKQVWNLTCMLDHLVLLNVIIDADTGNIIKFEKKSMMDFIKKR